MSKSVYLVQVYEGDNSWYGFDVFTSLAKAKRFILKIRGQSARIVKLRLNQQLATVMMNRDPS